MLIGDRGFKVKRVPAPFFEDLTGFRVEENLIVQTIQNSVEYSAEKNALFIRQYPIYLVFADSTSVSYYTCLSGTLEVAGLQASELSVPFTG